MIRDVTYIINTHGDYGLPLRRLLASMAYIPSDRIKIVRGGSTVGYIDGYTEHRMESIDVYHVMHDSYDYTGAIALLDDRIPTADHVFFLQDTMEFGMNTDYLIRQANAQHLATAVYGGQCNLVLYRRDYLEHAEIAQYIRQRRNLSKLESITHEGALWKNLKLKDHYPNSSMQFLGIEKPYSDVDRMKEYYEGVDLIKWKANWGQNMHALVTRP